MAAVGADVEGPAPLMRLAWGRGHKLAISLVGIIVVRGHRLALVAGVVVAGLLGLGGSVWAAEGVAFSPAITQVDIATGQAQTTFQVNLLNRTDAAQSFKISLVDFGSLNEQGGVAFLGEAAGELERKHGLAAWMKADRSRVDLPAGAAATLNITLENKPDLAAGGHYGAVLATNLNTSGAAAGDPRVGVKQVLSTLVLATKGDGGQASLELTSQSSSGGWWHLPARINYRFHNTGQVHVVPRGVSEIRDMTGRVVARGALNEESATILPDSYRRYSSPVTVMAKAWMPGRYSIATTYRYDGTDQTKQLITTFWYAGSVGVLVIVVVTVLVMIAFVWWMLHMRIPVRKRGK